MKFYLFLLILPMLCYGQNIRTNRKIVDESACANCHVKKNKLRVIKKSSTKLEHGSIQLKHSRAQVSCGNCHDKNNSDLLAVGVSGEIANFKDPSPVCQQCHEHVFQDWSKGIHGKNRVSCSECHDPHNVRFPKMRAEKSPERPPLGFPKPPGEHSNP